MNTLRPLSTVHYSLITLLTLLLLAPRVQADPPVMSGLTIWLDATDLNGDGNLANNPAAGTAVSQWDNKASGYSTLDAPQTTAGYRPKMFRDATTGKDVVRFNGSHLLFNDSRINTLMGVTNTMFAVARANMGGGVQAILGRSRSDGWEYQPLNFNGSPFATSVGSTWRCSSQAQMGAALGGLKHDTLMVISATVWGKHSTPPTILQFWKRDWIGPTASTPVTNATLGLYDHGGSDVNKLFVGASYENGADIRNRLTGDIGEILIYNRALSEAERGQVEDYLAGRWVTDYSTLLPVTLDAGAGRVRDVQVDSATNYTHVFMPTGQCSFVVNKRIDIEYLLVAGGGGGGSARTSGSGGGGGGGVLTNGPNSRLLLAAGTYAVTVGHGGAGGTNAGGFGMNGFNGGDSSITNAGGYVSIIARGGGGGGGDYWNNGSSGASGGGGAYTGLPGTNNAPGQGRNGGAGYVGANDVEAAGGGGGGYGGVGQAATASKGGDGGVGITNSLAGYALSFAGGGGGGKRSGGTGYGKDGGGNGVNGAPTTGRANSGGGGGGNGTGGATPVNGAAGGSGIVIVRYVTGGGVDSFEAWRQTYFTAEQLTNAAISSATADPDEDGLNNQQEYWAGTNPMNALSCLVLYAPTNNIAADGKFVVRWQSVSGKMYKVMAATNLLIGFADLATNIQATPTVNVHTDSVENAGQRFYRIKLE